MYRWLIENHKSINISGDKWLHTPHSFQLQTPPNLSALEKILNISNLIDYSNVAWIEELIKTHFHPYEAEDLIIPLSDAY